RGPGRADRGALHDQPAQPELHRADRAARVKSVVALCALLAIARGDELSSADKLRVAYSTQFAWTREGLPVVTVRVTEGRSEVVLAASNPLSGVRILPDGEGGPEVRGGTAWTVRAENAKPSKVRWHVVVAHARPGDASLQTELAKWRERGFTPRTVE